MNFMSFYQINKALNKVLYVAIFGIKFSLKKNVLPEMTKIQRGFIKKLKCFSSCCSVIQSCPTLCDPTESSTPDFPVLHHLPELSQTHVHQVSDAIQPPHPLSPPFSNLSQHQGLSQ